MVAPPSAAPVVVEAVGVAGVKAVAKPKPKPKPEAQGRARATRAIESRSSSSRSSSSSPAPASRSTKRYSNPAQSASGVVNIARGLLGIPYVYGGSTTAGFDCSGFTQYVFGKAGISIPRTASAPAGGVDPGQQPQARETSSSSAPRSTTSASTPVPA